MGDVTGPIDSFQGHRHAVPKGTTCDECDKPAEIRVQGETDSFGSEMYDFCRGHYELFQKEEAKARKAARCGICDWCKLEATDLRDTRDYEEGLDGPVYRVCGDCRSDRDREVQEYLDQNDDCFDDVYHDDVDADHSHD